MPVRDRRARGRARAAVPAAALAVMVASVLVVACGSSSKHAATTTTRATTTTASTTTTAAPASSTTAAPTTSTTPPNPNGPVVSAQGAELAAPKTPAAPVALPADCHKLAAAGETVECGRGSGGTAALLWVVRTGPGAAHGVDIYRVAANQATLVLTAADADGASWTGVQASTADIGGPAGTEIVVAYRLAGTGGQLHVDVVGGNGTVQFHRELDQGRVDVSTGEYHDWAAQFGPDDPNCCPSVYAAATVDFVNGQWRVGHQANVAPGQVPKAQIG